MTLNDFYNGQFTLSSDEQCPYFGKSVHYAGLNYKQLEDSWKKAFRRYNLTMVSLPPGMSLDLRLEIFRRINEGGTPLSAQDIRLSYYSESPTVRFIQLAGIYNPKRVGAKRMIENCKDEFEWPWTVHVDGAKLWKQWWNNTKTVTGQTSSEMFLWFIVSTFRNEMDRILNNKKHLAENLKLSFRNRTEEVLDIACAQLRFEDRIPNDPRLLPTATELNDKYFPQFYDWWFAIRQQCTGQANVSKHRSVALLIPGLVQAFDKPKLSDTQWGWVGRFISGARSTAAKLSIDFPESKGRWAGLRGQRKQLDAYFKAAASIKSK